jgi:hypothetical protein
MASIDYVDSLNKMYQGLGFPAYKWSIFDWSPWVPLEKPLEELRIMMASSAGIYRYDQEPFDKWAKQDTSIRKIHKDTPVEKLELTHSGFDFRDAKEDINCVFPIERLKELEETAYFGSLCEYAVTTGMGRLYSRTTLLKEVLPKLVESAEEQEADVVLLVPA